MKPITILKKLRLNVFVNFNIRLFIKLFNQKSKYYSRKLINKWPPSGVISCQFLDYDFLMYNECDDGLVNYFFYGLDYHEECDLYLFTKLSEHCKTIIDIGANTGLYSIISSKNNPNANIISFEPVTSNFERLSKNLKLNNCTNVISEKVALGENESNKEIMIPANRKISDLASLDFEFSKKTNPDGNFTKETVIVETLDNYRNINKLKIDLIKCDVEGFEISVFKGLLNILKKDKPTIIFECFLDDKRKLFFDNILNEYNYFVYLILNDGLVYLQNGFEKNTGGFNYLISPVKPLNSFIPRNEFSSKFKEIILLKKSF